MVRVYVNTVARGGSRTAATSKMEHFAIIDNGFQPLTIIIKSSILDVGAVLDPPLVAAVLILCVIAREGRFHSPDLLPKNSEYKNEILRLLTFCYVS